MTVDMQGRRIIVAVFECLRLDPEVADKRGQFREVFQSWLDTSARKFNAKIPDKKDHVTIVTEAWNVEKEQYPDTLDGIDAIIVTGSTASAYDDEAWIQKLEGYLQDVYNTSSHVRIFGGCFGHQLLAQAILGKDGVKVERMPDGRWEIGVHDVELSSEFRADFPSLRSESTLACQFLHGDGVVISPKGLPEGWKRVGSSKLCDVQGLYKAGKVLTYQGHPEFDEFINEKAVTKLGNIGTLDAARMEEYKRLILQKDKAVEMGVVFLEFLTA